MHLTSGMYCLSRYNYITQDIGQPPYLEEGQSARPYVGVYAKPADTALEVKQGLYYLDLQVSLTLSVYIPAMLCSDCMEISQASCFTGLKS